MKDSQLKANWLKEEAAAFSGWDFSHLDGRWKSEPLHWNYKEIVLSHLNPEHKLLDMGTGGGEFLLSLNHPYSLTYATEGYVPNVVLCKQKLSPLGIDIRQIVSDDEIPFDDNSFDIIINRHESFDLGEVKRVLKDGGMFITQQVGGENNLSLSLSLIDGFIPNYNGFSLESAQKDCTENGFEILYKNEQISSLKFFDVGAIVYFAKIIEWSFPNFSVNSCFKQLKKLQREIDKKGFVETQEHRFIIVSRIKND